MSNVEDIFDDVYADARIANYAAQGANPEEAARALELADASGVPAPAIYSDLEKFEQEHKTRLGAAIINTNPNLAEYFASDPMAAKLSHGDVGNLDAVSQAVEPLSQPSTLASWLQSDSIAKSFMRGFGEEPIHTEKFYTGFDKPQDIEWAIRHPAMGAVYGALGQATGLAEVGAEGLSRTVSGLLSMGYEGMSAIFGEPFARDMAGMAEMSMMRGDIGVKALGGAATGPMGRIEQNTKLFKSMHDALGIADHFTDAGKEPPVGVSPLIDESKKIQAKEDMDKLDEAIKAAGKTETGELSPGHLAGFVRQHVTDRTAWLGVDAIKKLYGETLPAPDDDLLGWIPGLSDKMVSADLAGGEIAVPLHDYLARVTPEVKAELRDFTSIRDTIPTLDDAKLLEPKQAIDEPVALHRASAGLQPSFMAGDRKLTLQRKAERAGARFGVAEGFHDFDILDEAGDTIGVINLSEQEGGKGIYIENIQAGEAENKFYHPNFLGPSLVRDLKRQIKAEFPKAEYVTGFRVGGAREAAGVVEKMPLARVKLDEGPAEGWTEVEPMREVLQGTWRPLAAGDWGQVLGYFKSELAPHEQAIVQAIHQELRRLVPHLVEHKVTSGLLRITPEGATSQPRGMYSVFVDRLPQIFVGLNSDHPIGTARHEAIHHLKQYGFFTPNEWRVLERTARREGWVDRYLQGRYKDLSEPKRIEESIAEAFRHWSDLRDAEGAKPSGRAAEVFAKLKDLFDSVVRRVKEITGRDLTADQIFDLTRKGEVGRREIGKIEEPQAFDPRAQFEEAPLEEPTPPEAAKAFGMYDRAKAMGVTEAHMENMRRHILEDNKNRLNYNLRKAEVKQKRMLTREWKERRTAIRDEVSDQLSARPDLATDALFAKGDIKLHPDNLTPEQKALLPKEYIQKKNGVNPDELAPYFGYSSGDALVERLGMLTQDRRAAGMSQRDYLNRLIDVETDRRLNKEFGDLGERIMDETKDQALSESQLKLTHEQTMAYAIKAGVDLPMTLDEVKEMVRKDFDTREVGSLNSDRLMMQAGALWRKVAEAEAAGKWQEAWRHAQKANHTGIAAKLAVDYERARRAFDRTAKTYSKRQVPSVPQEFLNWVHDLLLRTGSVKGAAWSVQDLAERIAAYAPKSLEDFVDAKEAEYMGMRELPVADFLLDPAFRKNVDELTHYEFMGLKQSIDALLKAGRDERSVIVSGEAWDHATWLNAARGKLATFGYKITKAVPTSAKVYVLRKIVYGMTSMETLLNRWDRGDPVGIFNKTIIYPLFEAANGKAKMLRETAQEFDKISRPKPKELAKLVDAPFPEPLSPDGQGKWEGFNRGNVLMMLQNAGNESNWNVLARGYGADPEALWKWLEKNVTKEDIERAQAVGSVFKKLIVHSDRMYTRLTGAPVQKIPLKPRTFELADGPMTVDGWYHPLDADPRRKSIWKEDEETGQPYRVPKGKRESAFDSGDFFHAVSANGYTKRRTGVAYPLNLDFNMMPTRIRQMIHDINFREPLLNIEKIFADKTFQEDVSKYYGHEYSTGMMPYLRALAGAEGINSEGIQMASGIMEKLRQNIISTYIGFNPFTILKHGPTAWVLSMKEVGIADFLSAEKELYLKSPSTARPLHEFIMKNSEELQRRERHWQDTLGAQGNELKGESNLRDQIIEWGSKGVALSDMISAKPTWYAAYVKAVREGMPHGTAVSIADRAVRRAHGSTAETNLAPFVRGTGKPTINNYLTSVYGFFGTVMQRRLEMAYKANDIYKLGREGEIKAAAQKMPSLLNDFMIYVVWPTVVEEAVTGLTTEDKRGWGAHILSAGTMGLASSFLYLRDLMYGITTGHDPGAGLISSALHDTANVMRDIKRGPEALNRQHAGKTVGDALTLFGEATGKMPKIVGSAARYGIDVYNRQQHPKNVGQAIRGIVSGHAERKER